MGFYFNGLLVYKECWFRIVGGIDNNGFELLRKGCIKFVFKKD